MTALPADVALLVIDLQPDFMPGGALPCHEGDAIVPGIAALLASGRYSTGRSEEHTSELQSRV